MKDANLKCHYKHARTKITLFGACFLTDAILCSWVLTRKQRKLKIFAVRLNVELADVSDNLQYKIIDPQSNNSLLCSDSSACVWIVWSLLIVSRCKASLVSVLNIWPLWPVLFKITSYKNLIKLKTDSKAQHLTWDALQKNSSWKHLLRVALDIVKSKITLTWK